MGKFGKKNVVSESLNSYMIGVMGPSGFGKTTLMYNVCEKEFGDDGYIIFDMGDEDGTAAINGVVSEKMPTWDHVIEVVKDIVKHKDEYPNLKVIVWDTLDASFEIAEKYAIKTWNEKNLGKKDFEPASSINSVAGGFGKGLEYVISIVKEEINKLKSVGVMSWWTAHVREKDQTDLWTGNSYTSLTANMMSKYFNGIKNISHVIAFGYLDREIEKTSIGEENPVTKKKRIRKNVVDEKRRLKFRDDEYIADAKGRFTNIVDEIPLDADMFIEAIKDAISTSRGSSGVGIVSGNGNKMIESNDEDISNADETPFDDLTEKRFLSINFEAAREKIREVYNAADADVKNSVKAYIKSHGKISDLNEDCVLELAGILNISL